MTNSYLQATVSPSIKQAHISALSKKCLESCGFTLEKLDKTYFYLYVVESLMEAVEFYYETIPLDMFSKEDDYIVKVIEELAYSEDEELDYNQYTKTNTEYIINGSLNLSYLDILHNIIKCHDKEYDSILIEGAYTCSKLRSGEFGGMVNYITKNAIQVGDTGEVLNRMRGGTW